MKEKMNDYYNNIIEFLLFEGIQIGEESSKNESID